MEKEKDFTKIEDATELAKAFKGHSKAVAGMDFKEIAKSAYLAYAASTGNKNYQGLPMPDFENLTVAIQLAWECAVRQAQSCLGLSGEHKAGTLNEMRWHEWTQSKLTNQK